MGVKLERYEALIARIKEDLAFRFFPNNSANAKEYYTLKHTLRIYDQIMSDDTELGGYPRTKGEQMMAGVVALLHDVLEDTDITVAELTGLYQYDLERAFFGVKGARAADVFVALVAITRNPGEEYAAYLKRVELNELATFVKVYDASDNLRSSYKNSNATLACRYVRALAMLCDTTGETDYAE